MCIRNCLCLVFVGSSRQFVGFNRELDESIVQQILDRAGQFFPALNALSLDIKIGKRIRIGHRPYSKLTFLYIQRLLYTNASKYMYIYI